MYKNKRRVISRIEMVTALTIGSVAGAALAMLVLAGLVWVFFALGGESYEVAGFQLSYLGKPFQGISLQLALALSMFGATVVQAEMFGEGEFIPKDFKGWKTKSNTVNAILYGVLASISIAVWACFFTLIASMVFSSIQLSHVFEIGRAHV